jgi:hypothetical protein
LTKTLSGRGFYRWFKQRADFYDFSMAGEIVDEIESVKPPIYQ